MLFRSLVDGRMHLYDVKMIHFSPSRCWPSHLKSRWQVEDEGEVSGLLLLGVDISASDGCVELTQSSYIVKLASTWFPDGVPESNQSNQPPADKDLPQHVADALAGQSRHALPRGDQGLPKFGWRFTLRGDQHAPRRGLRSRHAVRIHDK